MHYVLSSDTRLKKLRASGGYIMAYVDDMQQGKGNLGGPELFLAPIGRIDKEKITEFFCNKCESVFDGAPGIEYESPNEEVADNLVLIERGSYSCPTCNATLAEYREFKKMDESTEVGAAKPMAGMDEQKPAGADGAQPEKQAAEESEGQEQNAESEEKAPGSQGQQDAAEDGAVQTQDLLDAMEKNPGQQDAAEDGAVQQAAGREQNAQESSGQAQAPEGSQQAEAIKPIDGMSVFDENARMLGTVEGIGLDASSALCMSVVRNDGAKKNIALTQIKSIGEIIILSSGSGSADVAPSSRCAKCGFENKPGSKFCEECGIAL